MKVTALPDFSYEKKVWKRGFRIVAGVDEVGRGSWVGPVVASAVAFAPNFQFSLSERVLFNFQKEKIKIDDSKKMKPRERERAAKWIKENALSWGIGEVAASVINRLGMAKATKMVFRSAVANLKVNLHKHTGSSHVDFLLVDAFYVPYTRGVKRRNQLAIVKGDEKSISIAAASIIAKVYRDNLMRKLSEKHPVYRWERNKGYGTKEHQEGIRKYGITRLHRKTFVSRVRISFLSPEGA